MPKSVLRYPGGKTRAIKALTPFVPKTTKVLLSPFFGGGSFELSLLDTNPTLTIKANDGFEPLINFYTQLQKNRDKLVERLYELLPFTKEMFDLARSQLLKTEDNIDRAAYYFAINRSSFSGATCSGGYSQEAADGRFTESSIERCKTLDLTRITFSNLHFQDFLNNNPQKDDHFIYADPPYYLEKGSKLYGTSGDMHEGFDHTLLNDMLKKRKCWLLSYNDCKQIRKLYEFANINDTAWAYGMNKSKKSSELIITN